MAASVMACALLCTACMSERPMAQQQYQIDVKKKGELDHFFSECKSVRLQTHDSCLVSGIKRAKVADGVIAIWTDNRILCFNDEGLCVGKIDHWGNGEGEYLSISDFIVDKGQVYVLSALQKMLTVYDIRGQFVRRYELPDIFFKMEMDGPQSVVLASVNANSSRYNFTFFNLNTGKVTRRADAFGKNEGLTFSSYSPFLGREGGQWMVGHPFDYNIYALTEQREQLDADATLSFNTKVQMPAGSHSMPYEQLDENTLNKNVVRFVTGYEKCGQVRYITYPLFMTDGGVQTCLTKLMPNGDNATVVLNNDEDERFPMFVGEYLGMSDGCLVVATPAMLALDKDKEHHRHTWKDKGLKEEDNPIVSFFQLNSF